MTQEGRSFGKSFSSGEFTFSGKGPSAAGISAPIARSGIILFGLLLAWPAAADPGIGPTSSASVGISISVAPQFRLGTGGWPRHVDRIATSGGFCIATNSRPAALPVLLVRSGPSQPETIEKLPECDLGGRAVTPVAVRRSGTSLELFILRPE